MSMFSGANLPGGEVRKKLVAWLQKDIERPPVLHLVLYYVVYVLMGGFGQGLAIIPGVSITFWPPAGLFVATLLLTKKRSWPWFILAGCLAELTCNAVWFHNAVPFALIYFLANALEAITAALLVKRFAPRPFRLETIEEVATFVVLGAGVAPIVGATVIATTDAFLGKHDFTTAWPLVWLGDATGLLVSTPLTFVAIQTWRERMRIPTPRLIEGLVLVLVLIVVAFASFKGFLPTVYMTMPPLLWAAARFQLKGAAAALAIIAVMEALFTLSRQDPSTSATETLQQEIVMLQTFLGVSAVSALLVAALSTQRQQAIRDLKIANSSLEERIEERTANLAQSERQLATILEALPIGVALIDHEGRTLVGNQVYKRFVPHVIPSRDPERFGYWESYDSEGMQIKPENYPGARALRGEEAWPGQEVLYHGNEKRGPQWVRIAALPFRNAEGDVIGATVVISDIDQEKRTLDALRHSESQLQLALAAGDAGTWAWDAKTNGLSWDERYHQQFGFAANEEKSFATLIRHLHPEEHERIRARFFAMLKAPDDNHWDMEFRANHPSLGERWMLSLGRAERERNGRMRRMAGLNLDITTRKTHEQQTQLLMREVNHRSKNMLSLVLAIARQTAAGEPRDFVNRFQERVSSLAASQDLLTSSGWRGVGLADLVNSQLAHFKDLIGQRVLIDGPPLVVNASAAQALGMALHELATNAGKYGALSNKTGQVWISWRLHDDKDGVRHFSILWKERGGPSIGQPKHMGFGTTVINKMSKLSLDAVVEFDLSRNGVTWQLSCLAERVLERIGETENKA